MRVRGLPLVVLCLVCAVAMVVGVGLARWSSDRSPSPEATSDAPSAPVPRDLDFTLTQVLLPDGSTTMVGAGVDDARVVLAPTEGVAPGAVTEHGFAAFADARSHVYSVDLADEPATHELLATVPGSAHSVTVSADGGTAAVVSYGERVTENTLWVVDLADGSTADFATEAREGALSPDGRHFVSGDFDLTVLDVETGETALLRRPPPGDGGQSGFQDWVITRGGLVRAVSTGLVETWDLETGNRAEPITCACYRAVFDPEGALVNVATEDGRAVLIDLATGRTLVDRQTNPDGVLESFTVLGDGERAVTALDGLEVWDVESGRTLWEHTVPGYVVWTVRAVPGSRSFLFGLMEDPERTPEDAMSFDVRLWLATPVS